MLQFWGGFPVSLRDCRGPGELEWVVVLAQHDDDNMGEIEAKDVIAMVELSIMDILGKPYRPTCPNPRFSSPQALSASRCPYMVINDH